MPRWQARLDDAPWDRTIDAGYLGLEYGALVFRNAPDGDVLVVYAQGHWKSAERVVEIPEASDVFGAITREIVQG